VPKNAAQGFGSLPKAAGQPATAKRPKRASTLALAAAGTVALAAGTTVLFLFDPSESAFYPPCLFRACTGLYCPGCGTARALHALLHGHVGEAFGLNPLMVSTLPFMGYYVMSYAYAGVRMRPFNHVSPLWGWSMFGTILAYWVLRNIPIYPFSLLAP
jgi:hypothetical protein